MVLDTSFLTRDKLTDDQLGKGNDVVIVYTGLRNKQVLLDAMYDLLTKSSGTEALCRQRMYRVMVRAGNAEGAEEGMRRLD